MQRLWQAMFPHAKVRTGSEVGAGSFGRDAALIGGWSLLRLADSRHRLELKTGKFVCNSSIGYTTRQRAVVPSLLLPGRGCNIETCCKESADVEVSVSTESATASGRSLHWRRVMYTIRLHPKCAWHHDDRLCAEATMSIRTWTQPMSSMCICRS